VNQISQTKGVLLPNFPQPSGKNSLQKLIEHLLRSDVVSIEAKKLLESASPSRMRPDGNDKPLIAVEGMSIGTDPYTEKVKRFASGNGWSQPSIEDALRVLSVMSFQGLPQTVRWVAVMHKPVKVKVLGFTLDTGSGGIILTSHKAEPCRGWFCRNGGFVFRSC
jgi:hypothetical protein